MPPALTVFSLQPKHLNSNQIDRTYLKKRILVQNQGGREYQTGGASEANALRGKYIRYFEDLI